MKFKNKEELSKAYDELEKAYTKECQENKKLKEQLKLVESDKNKIWEPKEDDEYWTIGATGDAFSSSNNCNGDKIIIEQGNYFKTEEEADKQSKYNKVMNRFRKYVEAYSEPLDWGNEKKSKYYLFYDHYNEKIVYSPTFGMFEDAFQIYASSKQILKDAIIYSAGSEEEFKRIVFGVKGE